MNDYHNGDNLGLEPTTPSPEPPAAPQAAPSDEHVSVVGMPEFDALLDHIYEHGTASEGIIDRANAFARALLARHGQPAASAEPRAVDMEEYRAVVAAMEQIDPATLPGITTAQPAAKAGPKRRPYNTSGSLSEYGVIPECDVAQPETSGNAGHLDERAAFERHVASTVGAAFRARRPDGRYVWDTIEDDWRVWQAAWQARAALAQEGGQ